MEVGTAEPIEDKKKKKKLKNRPPLNHRSGLGGKDGGDDGNNGGGSGGNSGNNQPYKRYPDPVDTHPTNKSKILMWFLLLVVLMTFGGLIAAYVVIATNNALEWQPFSLPIQVWISTAIIIASSITYHIAKSSLLKEQDKKAKKLVFGNYCFRCDFYFITIARMARVNESWVIYERKSLRWFFLCFNCYSRNSRSRRNHRTWLHNFADLESCKF